MPPTVLAGYYALFAKPIRRNPLHFSGLGVMLAAADAVIAKTNKLPCI